MTRFTVADLSIAPDASIHDAMLRLGSTGSRILFVTLHARLQGSLTDGDIRRALLRGTHLNNTVSEAMNRQPQSVSPQTSPQEIARILSHGVTVIPMVDNDGTVLELITAETRRFIPVAEPNLGPRELNYVLDCMQSTWISSTGRYVEQFEEAFREYVGGSQAVAVTNGTLGIALSLYALGVGPGDEVIVPDITFAATANAVIQVGARPVLVDVDPETWGLSVESMDMALSAHTKAIMPVHLYGRPVELNSIQEFALANDLLVVEDCAEAFGSRIGQRHVGTTSPAGVFSFFANKTITTGEGGMVLFASPDHANRARLIRAHGMSPTKRYSHTVWGTNFRMTSLQAAVGIGQIERADELVERKRAIARRYADNLGKIERRGGKLPSESQDTVNSYWLYTLMLPEGVPPQTITQRMLAQGIETRPAFNQLSTQPAFSSARFDPEKLHVAHSIAERGLSLPSSTTLELHLVDEISETLLDVMNYF